MLTYINKIKEILRHGEDRGDRTGVGTISLFGMHMKFYLQDGFPLLTTKKVNFKSILHELLWFISGSTNNNDLLDKGVKIWNEWAAEDGSLGPIYGAQWRNWKTSDGRVIDQLGSTIENIKKDPYSRRHVISAWNPEVLPDPTIPPRDNAPDKAVLPPCHTLFQFYVHPPSKLDGRMVLDLQLYQRSADAILGAPFNIASYSLLLMMVAKLCDMEAGCFVYTIGDAHIYNNHIDGVQEQIKRVPRKLPNMIITGDQKTIDDFKFEDFTLVNYISHPPIKFEIAV